MKSKEHLKTRGRAEGADNPRPPRWSPAQVYPAAQEYVRAGLSLIPIQGDGSKRPAFGLLPKVWCEEAGRYRRPWGHFKERRPTLAEVRSWFRDSEGDAYGIAIIAGAVSGNLEIIDIDNWETVEPWTALVEERAPGLLDRLVRVKSPRPGAHVYFRSPDAGPSLKLARVPQKDPETGQLRARAVIELKGEAGYCLAPPSPGACHPSGRPYVFLGKHDLSQVPTITAEEREILLDCSRHFDRWPEARRAIRRKRHPGRLAGTRPGDDFAARADWGDILEPHGWRWVGTGGDGADRWCRAGKASGTSASTDFGNSDLLYVFSTNAQPFEANKSYTKFHAFTLLNHGGDFTAAARALAAAGFGRPYRPSRDRAPNPLSRYAGYARMPLRRGRI
jgi:putative DNA primase/helicase